MRIDYIGLFKGRSFMMTKVYPTVSNIILDFITFKIAILINLTKRILKIDKSIYIVTIYKCINTVYFIVDSSGMFVALTAVCNDHCLCSEGLGVRRQVRWAGCGAGTASRVSGKTMDRFRYTWVTMIGEIHELIAEYLGNGFR